MLPGRPILNLLTWTVLAWAVHLSHAPGQTPTMPPADPDPLRGVRRHGPKKASCEDAAGADHRHQLRRHAGEGRPMPISSICGLCGTPRTMPRRLHDLLIEHYGYKEENIHFLKGAKATKRRSRAELVSSDWLGRSRPGSTKRTACWCSSPGHGDPAREFVSGRIAACCTRPMCVPRPAPRSRRAALRS